MSDMAKKKTSETGGDRHAPRGMVAIPRDVYEAFAVLAEWRDRSVSREVKRLMIEELKKEGLWPQSPSSES